MTTIKQNNNTYSQFQLYNKLPEGITTAENLEEIIQARFKLLDQVEKITHTSSMNNHSSHNKSGGNFKNFYRNFEDKLSWENEKTFQNDTISHFLLCVANCNTEADRNWFVKMETFMYEQRLIHHNVNNEALLKEMGINLQTEDITNNEFIKKINFNIRNSNNNSNNNTNNKFMKISFEKVLNLIPSMNYYIHKGYVFINQSDLMNIISNYFKEKLTTKLLNLTKSYNTIMSDKRISSLIKKMEAERELLKLTNEKPLSLTNNNNNNQTFSIKDIEELSDKAFPLCMQILNKSLTHESHLKHNGRLQYGLFLKGIGLSLEESMAYWKFKFSKKKSAEEFEKNYAYNVRHSYGKEGKRADYPPWSCKTVINLPNPSSSETHGCPYKTFSEEKLKMILQQLGHNELQIANIISKQRLKEYSLACIKQFEGKYPNSNYEKVGIHPNSYYESAKKNLSNKTKSVGIKYENNKNNNNTTNISTNNNTNTKSNIITNVDSNVNSDIKMNIDINNGDDLDDLLGEEL